MKWVKGSLVSGVVIVGGSVGGLTAARELRAQGYSGTLTVVEAEEHGGYRRPMLSKGVLEGSVDPDRIALPLTDDLAVRRLRPARAWGVDFADQRIEVEVGGRRERLDYEWLIIASGAGAREPEIPGDTERALTLRTLADALRIGERLQVARDVVIIGAGFLGLEIAAAARSRGCSVTVVESASRPLARIADDHLSTFVASLHARHDVDIRCDATVAQVRDQRGHCRVQLADGRELPADVLIAAVGSAPTVDWLRPLSGSTARTDEGEGAKAPAAGVTCDGSGRVLDASGVPRERVLAVGDVCAWWSPLYGSRMRVEHWTHAIEQARHVAGVILNAAPRELWAAPYFWSEQFDARIQSVGWSLGHDSARILRDGDDQLLVAHGRGGVLVSVSGVNCGAILQQYRPLVEARTPLLEVPSPA